MQGGDDTCSVSPSTFAPDKEPFRGLSFLLNCGANEAIFVMKHTLLAADKPRLAELPAAAERVPRSSQ